MSLLGLTMEAPAAQAESFWGKTVADVRLTADAQMPLSEFSGQITQKAGEPLERAKVAESLKNLFATGRFRDLRVDAQEVAGGVEVIFVAHAQWYVGSVVVEGTPGNLEAEGLATATHLRLGQPVTNADLDEAKRHLKEVLADNAYYQATTQYTLEANPATQEARVTFKIAAGKPARLAEVKFQGETAFPGEQLRQAAGWRLGSPLSSARLERGLMRLRQFYQKRRRLLARTNIVSREFHPGRRTETLIVRVDAGPQVRVRVQGADVSNSKLRELLPMYREGVADDFAVQQGREALEDYFQRQGYFSATATSTRTTSKNGQQVEITYIISPGDPGMFVGYGFEGNHSVARNDLASVLTLEPPDFRHALGVYSNQLLASSTQALTDLYHQRGFLEARVTAHVNRQYQNIPDHLYVTFAIEEGPQTRVGNLTFEGVDPDLQKKLWPYLQAKPGEPYSPARAEHDRENIRTYFNNQGYPHAEVDFKATRATTPHQMDLAYQIVPGSRETIQRIFLMGNRHTKEGIIRRELTFHDGEPLNQSALLESQRKLYDLGIFNEVEIAPQDPEGPSGGKTVLVSVEEARRWTVSYGGGVEVQRLGSNQPQGQLKASPRLSLEINRLNVGGRGQTLTFRGRLSTLDKGAGLSYYIPRFPTRPDIHVRFNALVDRSSDVLTFTSVRKEASVALEKYWSSTTLVIARYSFRNVKALNLAITPQQVPLASRPAQIGMASLSYINDHRDNPVDATRGSFSLAEAGVSWSKLGSEGNFLRVAAQNSTYYRLGSHFIFARNTRFAVESPYGGLRSVVIKNPDGTTSVLFTHDIPLPERFFMGGSETHRGFSINQAGPRDPNTGFPIGGNALFLNSLELRVPFFQNRLGVVMFHDAGNVYSTIRRMQLLRITQHSPTDFDYTVHAVGFGFRYKTPVGPLRLDFGYSLNPPRFQVTNADGSLSVKRLPRIQIFLGVGQTF